MSRNRVQKLANLQPHQRGITIDFKVMEIKAVRKVRSRHDGSKHQVADVLIGDETGVMLLALWDDEISQIEPEKTFRIMGGRSSLFQGRLQVSLGQNGKLQASNQSIEKVNTKRNFSDKRHSAPSGSKGHKRAENRREKPVRRSRGFMWTRVERNSE